MQKLQAVRNHIIFQFENATVKHMGVNQFEETAESGLVFVRVDDSTKSPRWGLVREIGPECDDDICINTRVLIDPLMWSEGFEVGGETFWCDVDV